MFETLKIHGIEIKYPEEWVIHPIIKLERLRGELGFSLNKQDATPKLILSWKPLDQSKRKYGSAEEQAEATIKIMQKDGSLKSLEVVTHEKIEINGHNAVLYNIKVTLYKPALIMIKPKFIVKTVKFAMLFCEESDRSITIYSETEESDEKKDLFKEILSSLICHQPKTLNI
ncbi:MAG: hypothetical protein QW487_04720 [Candidatus Bathyarchaeia archaeon]|nr:hypothetical protein [Candidatus Bathyarchaeota archaeon]